MICEGFPGAGWNAGYGGAVVRRLVHGHARGRLRVVERPLRLTFLYMLQCLRRNLPWSILGRVRYPYGFASLRKFHVDAAFPFATCACFGAQPGPCCAPAFQAVI